MSLCEDCLPECDHDYCDDCEKCHLCGTFANAPVAPVNPGALTYRNPEWIKKAPVMVPSAFNEHVYTRYARTSDNTLRELVH